MIVIFGLKNCDSCQRLMTWLRDQKVDYHFMDYRKNMIDESKLLTWIEDVGWENLLNRRSSTWRNLLTERKTGLTSDSAKTLMLEFPTLIKRPIIELGGQIIVGFKEEQKEELASRQLRAKRLLMK